jgi:hypothetical protein
LTTIADSQQLMLDPSFLFSEEGLSWLEEEAPEHEEIVVSAAFAEWAAFYDPDREYLPLIAGEDREDCQGRSKSGFLLT